MWSSLLFVLACTRAVDPDERLRAGDLDGAATAWQAAHGAPLDVDHPVAQVLAARAVRDSTVTVAGIADMVEAVRFLEQAPIIRTQSLDLSFGSMADLGAALDALAEPPALVVVGRSEGLGDRDPYTQGADLPWKGGRIVGAARLPSATTLRAFGATIDENPPAKLVTLALRDATGELYLKVQRREGAWWAVAASDADAAARLLLAADASRDYGGPALRAREGGGFVRR